MFSGPLSLPAYVPEIKFNNNNTNNDMEDAKWKCHRLQECV